MRTHFTFLNDPGHGWLIVKPAELASVGLTEADISPCSYTNGHQIGLEEDCDAPRFMAAYKAKFGTEPEIIDDLGTCRNWACFGTRHGS